MELKLKSHQRGMLFGIGRKKHKELSDQELISLFVKEDCVHTIPILYERYAHLVMGSCMKYLKQVENAEDITIRIFTELGDKLKKHEISFFKSWLYQVTRNECLQFLRKYKPNQEVAINELAADDPSELEERVLKEIQLEQLELAIATLKPDQKKCVELFYIEQQSYQTIADQLDIPLNTVKSAIQNGKRNIKIWMESHEK